ncbi:MAG: dockerin type I repeat-containing protein [Prevotella sp.]|nr:dockerin type I repeat-containing protein [Prevotella sp.]
MYSKMKKLCCLVMLLLSTTFLHAQESGWSVNPRDYQYDMTIYAQLVVEGQAVSDYENYEVAAFVGDECRAVGEVFSQEGYTWVYLRPRSNAASGETVTIKVYDKAKGRAVRINESFSFQSQGQEGEPSSPVNLTMKMYTLGDVNDDGFIDIADVTSVLAIMAGNGGENLIEDAADVNEDGFVDIADVTSILSIMAGK